MKKMMMILAALSAVTLAQAAAINWMSGKFYLPDEDGKFTETKAKTAVMGYVFIIDAELYDTLKNPNDVYAKFDKVAKTFNGMSPKIDPVQSISTTSAIKMTTTDHGVIDNGDGTVSEKMHYAAVVYEYIGTEHWIANTAAVNVGDPTKNYTKGNLGAYWHGVPPDEKGTGRFTGVDGAWNPVASTSEPVPEPMCVALLAFGAVALGLRRKRS